MCVNKEGNYSWYFYKFLQSFLLQVLSIHAYTLKLVDKDEELVRKLQNLRNSFLFVNKTKLAPRLAKYPKKLRNSLLYH